MPTRIQDNAVVLFQGDSITEHGRVREDPADMGAGYALIASAWFSLLHPRKRVAFLNRGIGGNRVTDLTERWEVDCITLAPNWVSILVGVNNTWRRFDGNDPTSVEDFERDYRALLNQTYERLNPQVILCEPFLVPVREEQKLWREDLEPKIEVVRRLSREFNTILVPLDSIFAQAAQQREATFWLSDGVHATPAGAALIAHAWLKAVDAW
jgi:acyl-CoA thioesterase-1